MVYNVLSKFTNNFPEHNLKPLKKTYPWLVNICWLYTGKNFIGPNSFKIKLKKSMKKLIHKPGFESIFAISMIVILGLPPLLLAQNTKEMTIKIENGDTIVNGKNIKDLLNKERAFVMKDIKHITTQITIKSDSEKTTPNKNIIFNTIKDSAVVIGPETIQKEMEALIKQKQQEINLKEQESYQQTTFSLMNRIRGRNTASFDYVNYGNDGIGTHIRFSTSDVSSDDLKRLPYVQGGKFELENLMIVPEFSSGNILLTFSLPANKEAEVKFINSSGNIIWTEKTQSNAFKKEFSLILNGIYYLQVRQGNSFALKRITKEN